MRSMTGYSQLCRKTPIGSFVVEIHSVNRKGLDLTIALPKELSYLEIEVRKWLSRSLFRGQITLKVQLQVEDRYLVENELLSLNYLKATWEKIASSLGYDPKQDISLDFLVQRKEGLEQMLSFPEKNCGDDLQKIIEELLSDFLRMKNEEGIELKKDIEHRLLTIENGVAEVFSRAAIPIERYRQKLKEKLREFYQTSEEEARIFREIALLSEKLDITEEITRLFSHIKQFFQYMNSEEQSVGRTLDFLSQEIQRELNTMSAKSTDAEAIHKIVFLKGELEKIREQIQNIE